MTCTRSKWLDRLDALVLADDNAATVVLAMPVAGVVANLTDQATAPETGRTISGIVAPYNTPGATSAGVRTVRAGAVHLPSDLRRVKLYGRGHDRDRPVGYGIAAQDTAEGMRMTFRIGRTPDGDTALLEASEGIRDAFSVELDDVVTEGDGLITASMLVGVALCALPAFASARVAQVAAEHVNGDPLTPPAGQPPTGGQTPPPATPLVPPRRTVTAAAPARDTVHAAAGVLAAFQANPQDPTVAAALTDITYTGIGDALTPGWLGELWTGVRYARQITPMITNQSLTSYRYTGWRFTQRPGGGVYAGDKAQIPSKPVAVEPVSLAAKRWAGGNDIDRAVVDFGDTEFLDAYSREMADSYAWDTDDDCLDTLLTDATPLAASTLSAAIVTAIFQIGTTGLTPDFIRVSADLLEALADVTNQNMTPLMTAAFGNLDLAKLLQLSFRDMPPGTILMGAKSSATFRELPGSPLRFDALELARGGVDRAFFGYHRTFVNKPAALVRITVDGGTDDDNVRNNAPGSKK